MDRLLFGVLLATNAPRDCEATRKHILRPGKSFAFEAVVVNS